MTSFFADAPAARRLALPYALGAVGLGAVGIAFQDFALQWQPVPSDLPYRAMLATLFGFMLVAGGVAFLIPRLTALASLAAATTDSVWVAILLLPKVAASPGSVVAWLGVAEIGALAAGGMMIFATAVHRPRLMIAARVVIGCCALMFGLSHFAFADFTAGMVPKWIPAPLFWAYATGLGHVFSGFALITGFRARLAATLLAAMCGAFVVLLHAPRVLADPSSHAEWTMLFIALSIAGSAWTARSTPSAHDDLPDK